VHLFFLIINALIHLLLQNTINHCYKEDKNDQYIFSVNDESLLAFG